MRKKSKTIKASNQSSFYFEDYIETNRKNKFAKKTNIFLDRIYLLFFSFFCLILIFSIKIIHISSNEIETFNQGNEPSKFVLLRRDIVDRNGILISRNIKSFDVAINPKLIKDKNNFLLKIRLNFPSLPINEIEKKLNKNQWFYLKRRIDQSEREKLWALGEKGIIFEHIQARMYTHGNLFSHIIGQVDYDNYGVSGLEKYFDKELKDKKLLKKPIKLTLDSNIQYIINKELNEALRIFKATGGGALLMDVKTGDIISLVSLPNFNINKREEIKYINKITKGVYELGSVFKTFTVAMALDYNLFTPQSEIKDIPRKLKCSSHEISDIKEFPKNLSVENILIRSSNIGTLLVARKIGEKKFKKFIDDTNLLKSPEIQLEEVGNPINFNWNKCKLETVSFGHGITTTPLQAASIYAALVNGGRLIKPNLIKNNQTKNYKRIISEKTSQDITNILRKVVTDKKGTASLADVHGYNVGGKTGTSQNYKDKNENLNTFISVFPTQEPKYTLLVMLQNPQVAKNLIYNYRGMKIKGTRNEAGWNSVYVAGKIIKKIGPILAINNEEFTNHVAEKIN